MENLNPYTKEKFIPALGFNFLTKYYDTATKALMPKRFRQILVNQLNAKEGEQILDFGIGTGETTILIKNNSADSIVVGIDIDPNILKIAAKKIHECGYDVQLVQIDSKVLPFTNNTFDKVASCLVFCSLNPIQKRQYLSEIHRILKDGGHIYIADWGFEKNKIKRFFVRLIHGISPFKLIKEPNTEVFNYLKNTGFKNVSVFNSIKTLTGTLVYYSATK